MGFRIGLLGLFSPHICRTLRTRMYVTNIKFRYNAEHTQGFSKTSQHLTRRKPSRDSRSEETGAGSRTFFDIVPDRLLDLTATRTPNYPHRRASDKISMSRNIHLEQNIERKISKANYRSPKILKPQNIEIIKYPVAKYEIRKMYRHFVMSQP